MISNMLCAGALLCGAVALPLAVGVESASATPPQCQAAQLVPTFERGEGAMGHLYDTWRLTNEGTRCRTRGWVGGLNFGPDGRPLPTTITRTNGPLVGGHARPRTACELELRVREPRHHRVHR